MSDPLRLRYPAHHPLPDTSPQDGTPPQMPLGAAPLGDAPPGDGAGSGIEPPSPTELDRARALLHQQRARSAAFASARALFHDPAWDILLGLFVAYEEGTPLTIDAVQAATGLSEVTIRRWLLTLEHRGLITCWPHTAAWPQRSLGLTDEALTMMLQFLQEI